MRVLRLIRSERVRRTVPALATLMVIGATLGWGLTVHPGERAPGPCASVVVVDRADPVTCDLDGSQVLIETGMTGAECLDSGGLYRQEARACLDTDY